MVCPSEKELQAMGNTEQEQAEAMKRYIREVFIPEYAKNFNKELSASDIKFYGKIHFDRNRFNNAPNTHCHLIVSRKDQTNKKKLSPLTNHKHTNNGIIKGGFNRVNLFQQAEQGFDRLFNYNRQQTESFDYHNTTKNDSVSKQLKLQEQNLQSDERKTESNIESKKAGNQAFNTHIHTATKQKCNTLIHRPCNQDNFLIDTPFISPVSTGEYFLSLPVETEKALLKRKKKKKYKKI